MWYNLCVGMRNRDNRVRFDGRGKSELHRAVCWITSSEGDLRESAIEIYTADLIGKGGKVR